MRSYLEIKNTISDGTLKGKGNVGGIIGQLNSFVNVARPDPDSFHPIKFSEVYAGGDYYGKTTGGLIGLSLATNVEILNSYVQANLTGFSAEGSVGGFIGSSKNHGGRIINAPVPFPVITNSYSSSKITPLFEAAGGGLIGIMNDDAVEADFIRSTYFDVDRSPEIPAISNIDAAELEKTGSEFSSKDFSNSRKFSGWKSDVWYWEANGYPVLNSLKERIELLK